ncbi:OmpP1/FadL family transporter [Microbulbifer sp. SA54]|uniref:OmpP1/FadL family transporter n=1 Tax=Microbulbifer sp. SA54 TaxID=3401577 RepID=UPI003AAC834C
MTIKLAPLSAAIASSTALLTAFSAQATNGYFVEGAGPKAQAMAGVGIALPQDALTAANNPAGTALVGDRLDIGLTWFSPDRSARISGNQAGADGDYDGNDKTDFVIPELGYTRALSPSLSYGIAVYGNGGMNTSYESNPFAAFGSSGAAGVDLAQLFITPSLAYRPTPEHAFGVAATFAVQRFEATGLQAFDNPYVSASAGNVTDRGHDTAHGWGVKLGWIGRLHENLSLGLTWSSRIETSDFDRYQGLFADGGGFDIPENYGAGLSWTATPRLTLAADWQRILYSDTGSVGNSLGLLFEGKPLGAEDGPGFGWEDVEVTKIGAAYRLTDALTLRAGFSHAEQPIPDGEAFINILAPGVIEDHGSLGADWNTSVGEFTVSYTHAFENKVQGNNSIPAAFGGGEAELAMDQDILRFGWSRAF